MLFEIRLRATAVPRAENVLETGEHRAADDRIGDQRNVERRLFVTRVQRVGNPVPAERIGAAKVYVDGGIEITMHADVRIHRIETGLSAIPADGLEPAVSLGAEGKGAVVLRAAHPFVCRIPRIDRHALELQRRESRVDAVDLTRDRLEPCLAISEVVAGESARCAVAGRVDELAVGAHDTAIGPDDGDARVIGIEHDRVLIGMHALGRVSRVVGHVGEVHAGIGRAHHRAAVGTRREGPEQLVVIHAATDPDGVGVARRRADEDVVEALRLAETEAREAGRAVGCARQCCPSDVTRTVEQ